MKRYDVWGGSYLVSGMEGIPSGPQYLGSADADSFDEAVKMVCPNATKRNGKWFDWEGLYPSEEHAMLETYPFFMRVKNWLTGWRKK